MNTTLGEELIKPTKIYVEPILKILNKHKTKKIIKGMAHITGDWACRKYTAYLALRGCAVTLERSKWSVPKIFNIIQDVGNIAEQEMFHVFNMGIGMVLIVSGSDVKIVLNDLKSTKEPGTIIGEVMKGRSVRIE